MIECPQVSYAEFRDHIWPGDGIFFQGAADWHRLDRLVTGGPIGSLESWFIRWGTQTSYIPWRLSDISHPETAYFHDVFGEKVIYVVGAVGAGVRIRRFSELVYTDRYLGRIFHRPLLAEPERGIAVARFAHDRTGGKYASLFQFPLTGCRPIRRMWHKLGWNMDLQNWVCSEFFTANYRDAGFSLGENEFGEPMRPCDCTPIYAATLPFFGDWTEIVP